MMDLFNEHIESDTVTKTNPFEDNPRTEWEKAIVQSLAFEKTEWTLNQAKRWAREHDYKYGKVDETPNFWRLRQTQPEEFDDFRWGKAFKSAKLNKEIHPIYGGILLK